MSQFNTATVRWVFENTEEGESQRQDLEEERQRLAEEKRKLEREKRDFSWKKQVEEKQLLQEKQLFEMKWRILEEELQKLAKEKQEMEWEREQYFFRRDNEEVEDSSIGDTCKTLFFTGVETTSALKKRYKDLIKIFHPDNIAGDTGTIQIINREYDELKRAFEG